MTTKTFRIWISGKISPRHSNIIIHNMIPDLGYSTGDEQTTTPIVRNMHREVDESYFDIEFPNVDENNIDYVAKVNTIKQYLLESSVQYQDITTEPPKVGGSNN